MMALILTKRWLVTVLIGLAGTGGVWGFAPSAPENRAFDAAARSFNDGFYERAEREWGDFVKQFGSSDRVPQAILYQAQARMHVGRYAAAADLLNGNFSKAGKLADQYRYGVAEGLFQLGNFPAAAAAYARLIAEFPRSPLRLRAAYGEASAWFNAGDLAQAIARLRQPAGAFQPAAQAQPHDEFTARGYLLAAEILLRQNDYRGAEDALRHLDTLSLAPDLRWRKQYLTIQIQMADQRLDAAFQDATNLMTWTVSAGLRTLQAETVALQGDILQKLGQPEAAIQIYTNNLAAGVPLERQRQAWMKIIELSLLQQKTADAANWLETFLRERPKDPNLDLIRLTLGELKLKACAASAATNAPGPAALPGLSATNLLAQARAQFDEVITNFPQSPLIGKAHLDRGWCLWEEGKTGESETAFKEATTRLPLSEDQAVARFKWADTQFLTGDFAGAVTNYQQVLDYPAGGSPLPRTMFEQALFQMVRAGIKSDNAAATTNALARILSQYPNSFFCDDSLLLVGQDLNRQGPPGRGAQGVCGFPETLPGLGLGSRGATGGRPHLHPGGQTG
jgi:tetratricopeptide (TPR) repeat protein